MIRIYGDFIFYILMGRRTDTKTDSKWFYPSFDSFGTPPGFAASDPCWQKIGEHATFDKEEDIEALKKFAKAYPEYSWKVMKVTLSQHQTEVASMSADRTGESFDHPYPATEDYRRRIRIIQGSQE